MSNILLLTVDCLRYDSITPQITPHIYELSQESKVYENCYAEYGHTQPSFQTLFESEWIYTLRDAGYYTIGINYNAYLSRKFGYNEGFDFWHDLLDHEGDASFIDDSRELNEVLISQLYNIPQPFFAWVHYMDCHAPYYPHKWTRIMRLADCGMMTIKVTKKVIKQLRAAYNDAVTYLDSNIGYLFTILKRMELYENTTIIISADHGEEFYEHKRFGHAADRINEEVLHIPLIMKGNGRATIEKQCYFKDISKLILNEIT